MPKRQAHDQRLAEASPVVAKARALAAAGHHAAVVEFLGSREQSELEDSTLALLYGIAQARLGRHEQGLQWIDRALGRARQLGEHGVERHALNARGAIALVSGNLTEAADFCTQALMAASRDGDHATTGRASNNLGIISHLRGRHAEAISSWEIAAAAFHRAGMQTGVADCQHNLANAYREQKAFDKALATADQAVAAAEATRDETLYAMTLRGRAEIRAVRSEPELARRDLDRIRSIRSQMPTPLPKRKTCESRRWCWPWRTICLGPRKRCGRSWVAPSCTSVCSCWAKRPAISRWCCSARAARARPRPRRSPPRPSSPAWAPRAKSASWPTRAGMKHSPRSCAASSRRSTSRSSSPTPAAMRSCSPISSSAPRTSSKSRRCSRCSSASRTAVWAGSRWASNGRWSRSCAPAR